MLKQFLETGKITGTHGVRGEVRIHPWCDSPDFLTGFKRLYLDDAGKNHVDVERARVHGTMVIMKLAGVDDIPSAERLRNKILYISRADAKLDVDAVFVQDLIGCSVIDADSGVCYGTVSDVSQTGANDVWHILSENGRQTLIPAIPDVVVNVDAELGEVLIRPLKGLFDDAD